MKFGGCEEITFANFFKAMYELNCLQYKANASSKFFFTKVFIIAAA